MATKTLSVDEGAYLRLMSAKMNRRESFSAVIKRAHWDTGAKCCGDLLARVSGHVPEGILNKLDQAQVADAPPPDKWNT
jgi:predicted CopG family antitoxin